MQLGVVPLAVVARPARLAQNRLHHDAELEHQLVHPDPADARERHGVADLSEGEQDLALEPCGHPDEHLGWQGDRDPREGGTSFHVGEAPDVVGELLVERPGAAPGEPFLDGVPVDVQRRKILADIDPKVEALFGKRKPHRAHGRIHNFGQGCRLHVITLLAPFDA